MAKKMLGEILLEEKLIDPETLRIALEKQKQYALTDVTAKDKLPIPYVIQPDWKIAWFFKLALLPLLAYFLAKMATNPENFPTLLILMIVFLVMDLVLIRHTYVQKVVLFEDRFIYKGLHVVSYASISKVETQFVINWFQTGYRVKVHTKDREFPVWINISFFDNTDLKVFFSIIEKQGINVEMNEFTKKMKEGKTSSVETEVLKWVSLLLGILILVIAFFAFSKLMFKQ